MTNQLLASKEDIIKCLTARQNGHHIQEANQFISKIEVCIYINIKLIDIAKFYEYKSLWEFTVRNGRKQSFIRPYNYMYIWIIKKAYYAIGVNE